MGGFAIGQSKLFQERSHPSIFLHISKASLRDRQSGILCDETLATEVIEIFLETDEGNVRRALDSRYLRVPAGRRGVLDLLEDLRVNPGSVSPLGLWQATSPSRS